jgi:hypothetical protein
MAQTITISPANVVSKQSTTFTFDNAFLNLNTTGTYIWSWGDGSYNTTTATNVASHTYWENGVYVVAVSVSTPLDYGSDWNVSSDWGSEYLGTFVSSVMVSSDPLVSNVFDVSSAALGMFVIVVFISAAVTIVSVIMMLRYSETIDPKLIVLTVITVVVIDVFICVAILILDGVQNAIVITRFLMFFASHF